MTTGENIRLYRLLRGLSQTELGKLAGVDQSYLARYESDRLKLPKEYVPELAQELGVEAEWLGLKSKPPYSLYVGNPVSPQMKARQIGGIAKSLLPTLRSFIEEFQPSVALRALGAAGCVYLLAGHHLNHRGVRFAESSVLIFSLPGNNFNDLLQPVVDYLAGVTQKITLEEQAVAAIQNYSSSAATDLKSVAKALCSLLEAAKVQGAEWVDPEKLIADWQQQQATKGRRTTWFVTVNLKVESSNALTRQEALELATTAVKAGSGTLDDAGVVSIEP